MPLNRSFISDELRTQESDMVFSVPFRLPGEPPQEVIVYILIEHQSSPEALMRLRLLIYMVRLWEEEYRLLASRMKGQQQGSPILSIVFYTGSVRGQT